MFKQAEYLFIEIKDNSNIDSHIGCITPYNLSLPQIVMVNVMQM